MNDLVDVFDSESCDPVSLGSAYFNCWLYADDVVLVSQSAKGLLTALTSSEIIVKTGVYI